MWFDQVLKNYSDDTGKKMNEYVENSLYDVLDKLSTKLVQLYYLNSWELDDKDGMRVAGNILYARNYYNADV